MSVYPQRITVQLFIMAVMCQGCFVKSDGLKNSTSPICFPNAAPLLASSFNGTKAFTDKVLIEYISQNSETKGIHRYGAISLFYVSNGDSILTHLKRGVSQNDIIKIRDGSMIDKLSFSLHKPKVVSSRVDLNKIYKLARRRPTLFGEGDVAFYDLAEMMLNNMILEQNRNLNSKDFSELGFINTYNHIVAQALITIIYSDAIADSIACYHERIRSDELINPLDVMELSDVHIDNYVDMINNEIGQRLGIAISDFLFTQKYEEWNPKILAKVLNLIQSYFSRHFQISFKPFHPEDPQLIKFAHKINIVNAGVPIVLD